MNREELNARYNDAMRRADGWGQFSNDSNDLKGRHQNGKDYSQKIREAQKEASVCVQKLQELNRKEGVKPNYSMGRDQVVE